MTTVPILAMLDFKKLFIMETDPSGYGLGIKAQDKSIYEKELMAIVKVVLKWRPYLMGRRFLVRTDQLSLKYILEQRVIGSDYQK